VVSGRSPSTAERPSPRILLVEDDERLGSLLGEYLAEQGFRVTLELRGDAGAERVGLERPDLLILDVMLPGLDGFEVCRRVRPVYAGPILFLTARTEDVDHVVGLELGADDYVVKPVEPRVLLARVRALMRRTHPGPGPPPAEGELAVGALRVDRARREARLAGRLLPLSTAEFDLLWTLAARAGEVLDREALLGALRGIGYDGLDRSIDMRVSKLRQKLGDDPDRPQWIRTVRGVGYLFAPPYEQRG